MSGYELRDRDEARRFLLQGLWWQRVRPPAAAAVRPALEWALELAAAGQPLPPPGFVADVGHLAFGEDGDARAAAVAPGLPANLVRAYEDHTLGKLYADWSFTRAADALRHPRYRGRDRARGLAYLVNQFRERVGFPGVEISPGVIKAALEAAPGEVLNQGWESLRRDGPAPPLAELYAALNEAVRRAAEVLGREDLFELESGKALAPDGERLALRQVLHAAGRLEEGLPRRSVRPAARRRDVPTRVLDEDVYPVGGFSSISTRGSVESLLHSQLAYMEERERPDLFDVKFLRDELLYYARDENQFLRRRRTFVFALDPDLSGTRYKEKELPYQQGVLLLALALAAVRTLTDWLGADALAFKFVFLGDGDNEPLEAERALLATLLQEPIAGGAVRLLRERRERAGALCDEWARRSLCHCLLISCGEAAPPAVRDTEVTLLRVRGPRPLLGDARAAPAAVGGEDALDSWGRALEELLRRWV